MSKRIFINPCAKMIDSEQTAELFVKRIFPHTGIPDQIISDCGPQFASRLFRSFLCNLGIESALSMAYHPQTNRQMERVNQELEQYL